jgi:hypothetical protein
MVSVVDLLSFTQKLMQTLCSILPSIADKTKQSQKSTRVKTMHVHSLVSRGRLMQYACRSMTVTSPLIFFHQGSYNYSPWTI